MQSFPPSAMRLFLQSGTGPSRLKSPGESPAVASHLLSIGGHCRISGKGKTTAEKINASSMALFCRGVSVVGCMYSMCHACRFPWGGTPPRIFFRKRQIPNQPTETKLADCATAAVHSFLVSALPLLLLVVESFLEVS